VLADEEAIEPGGTQRVDGAVRKRDQEAALATKTHILDEFVETGRISPEACGPASRAEFLTETTEEVARAETGIQRGQRSVVSALGGRWLGSAKRFKTLIRTLVAPMEKHGHLQTAAGGREGLLQISATTIARLSTQLRERVTGPRRRKGVHATSFGGRARGTI